MRAGMASSMSLDEYEVKSHRLILAGLALVQKASVDLRIFGKVPIKVLIGNDGGMAPQISIQFLGAYWKQKTLGAEIELFLGGEAEVAGHIDIYPIENGSIEIDLLEHVNLTTMKEVEG